MSAPGGSPGTSIPPAIVDTNALTRALHTLKLGGMLQTLDARLAQARAGELGHLEFLQVLCLDEISRRETTAAARPTGDGGAPAHLHGPLQLFAEVITLPVPADSNDSSAEDAS